MDDVSNGTPAPTSPIESRSRRGSTIPIPMQLPPVSTPTSTEMRAIPTITNGGDAFPRAVKVENRSRRDSTFLSLNSPVDSTSTLMPTSKVMAVQRAIPDGTADPDFFQPSSNLQHDSSSSSSLMRRTPSVDHEQPRKRQRLMSETDEDAPKTDRDVLCYPAEVVILDDNQPEPEPKVEVKVEKKDGDLTLKDEEKATAATLSSTPVNSKDFRSSTLSPRWKRPFFDQRKKEWMTDENEDGSQSHTPVALQTPVPGIKSSSDCEMEPKGENVELVDKGTGDDLKRESVVTSVAAPVSIKPEESSPAVAAGMDIDHNAPSSPGSTRPTNLPIRSPPRPTPNTLLASYQTRSAVNSSASARLGIGHVDLLYKTDGGIMTCRMCLYVSFTPLKTKEIN